MKKNNRQLSASALVLAGNKINADQWSAMQSDAVRRDLSVAAILAENGLAGAETVRIELPAAFVSIIKEEFRFLEIPASQVPQGIVRALLAVQLCKTCEVWSGHVYPDRVAAQRVAGKIFSAAFEKPSVALYFNSRGRVVSELFRNPLATLNAA